MSGRRYLLSRPRTKMYDYNYTMGERLYRPMMDSLDKRGARGSSVTAEPAPTSSFTSAAATSSRRRSLDEGSENEEVSATIRRIRASRAAMEDETRALEGTQVSRRAAVRSRLDVSDRLMDSVGLKANEHDEYTIRKPRRAISELEDDSFFKKRTFASNGDESSNTVTRWTKVGARNGTATNGSSNFDDDFDTGAAAMRAKQSRARIAEIENEMEELSQRGKARSARLAAAGAVLAECADQDSSSSSAVSKSVRVKRTVVTEKRSVM